MTLKRKEKNKDTLWVMLAWGLNIAGVFAILLVVLAYFYLQNVSAASSPTARPIFTITVPPTYTQDPALLWLPTITPNPRSTMIVVQSPTPFVIENFALQANARISVIGYSVSGRPLEVYTFGHGEKEKMIVAGIHGGYEWNTIALADELIQHIFDHPEIIPSDVTLHILRNMNPDGDARDHGIDGRVNDHGVDLNRNFPSNWAETWNRTGCWNLTRTTGGTGPGSEPETKAVMYFLQSHDVETLISYHSAALGVFPGGVPWEEKSIQFSKALSKATGYPYPPIDTGCVYTGTLADYAVDLGITAVDMELSTHKYTDFEENLKALEVLLNWSE